MPRSRIAFSTPMPSRPGMARSSTIDGDVAAAGGFQRRERRFAAVGEHRLVAEFL